MLSQKAPKQPKAEEYSALETVQSKPTDQKIATCHNLFFYCLSAPLSAILALVLYNETQKNEDLSICSSIFKTGISFSSLLGERTVLP